VSKGILLWFCVASLLMAEDCVQFKKAAELAGKEGCVTGRVVNVSESRGGNVFVNFCKDYRHCPFSAVVLKKSHAQLGDLQDLEGRTVEFRGTVKLYQGAPEMELTSREQLRIPDDKASKSNVSFDSPGPGSTGMSGGHRPSSRFAPHHMSARVR
jgi:hypothetical protein